MKRKRNPSVITAALVFVALLLASCQQTGKGRKSLTLAINSGVEGDALKQAAMERVNDLPPQRRDVAMVFQS